MCFTIDPEHPTEKTAEKDIVCYKALRIENCNLKHKYYSIFDKAKIVSRNAIKTASIRTPYMDKKVNLNSLKRAKFTFSSGIWSGVSEINQGLHSFSKIRKRLFASHFGYRVIVVKSIIPKGAKYYYDSCSHEYVSTKLFIGDKIVWHTKDLIINDKKLLA